MDHYSDVIGELVEPTESLRDMSPEVWAGFARPPPERGGRRCSLGQGQGADGPQHRRGQAVRRLHRLPRQGRGTTGRNPEEVAEALGVALLMDGGTASVYGPRAWDAYREFARPRTAQTRAASG